MKLVLNSRAAIEHRGTAFGDVHPRHEGAQDRILSAAKSFDVDEVAWARLDFTNRVAGPADLEELRPGLLYTSHTADGFILDRRGRAVLIANADCAVGVLAGPTAIVVMHLGLACLWREDGEPTVLQRAVDALGVPGSELSFWIGAGIGPCCHGYDLSNAKNAARAQALTTAYGPMVCSGEVASGPRRGLAACDHVLIGELLARSIGIARVEVDRTCTSCAGMVDPNGTGYGRFFSNTRDALGMRERNLVLVRLV